MNTADPRVSDAVVVWTGHGRAGMPVRDEAPVIQQFGDLAIDLIPLVRLLEDAFYETDAQLVAADIEDMRRRAKADFLARHPEISDEAADALAWCYSWDFR